MPDDFRISELPSSASFNNGDLIEVSQVDAQSESGFTSVKKQMTEVGEMINNGIEYTLGLDTTSKKIIGAINEVNSEIPSNSDFTLSGLSDTAINTPIARNTLAFDGDLQKWVNSIPNELVGSIASGGSIRSILVDTNIPNGVYFYNSRYASDNPETAVTVAMIYKNNANGTYSKVYAFINDKIYFAKADSSVPATLTWVNLAKPTTEDITSQVTWNEGDITGTNTRVYCKNNVVYLNYQGLSATHSGGDTLFTLPSGYRPLNLLYTPFVVNGGAFGNFEIARTGVAKINQISSTTTTGRIYATVSFPII